MKFLSRSSTPTSATGGVNDLAYAFENLMDEEKRENINMKKWFMQEKLPNLVDQVFDVSIDGMGISKL
jgi:hypothetical protein